MDQLQSKSITRRIGIKSRICLLEQSTRIQFLPQVLCEPLLLDMIGSEWDRSSYVLLYIRYNESWFLPLLIPRLGSTRIRLSNTNIRLGCTALRLVAGWSLTAISSLE